jgi:hypothetical protein
MDDKLSEYNVAMGYDNCNNYCINSQITLC